MYLYILTCIRLLLCLNEYVNILSLLFSPLSLSLPLSFSLSLSLSIYIYIYQRGLEYADSIFWIGVLPKIKGCARNDADSIQWWGYSSEALGRMKYNFIAITQWLTLTRSGSTCQCSIDGSNRSLYLIEIREVIYKCAQTNDYHWIELLMLDRNTWNHLTECTLFLFDRFGLVSSINSISTSVGYIIYLFISCYACHWAVTMYFQSVG